MAAAVSNLPPPRAAALARRELERTDFEVSVTRECSTLSFFLCLKTRQPVLFASQVAESVLARDLIYACQGIDSKYLHYNVAANQNMGGFEIDSRAGIPAVDRQVLLVLSEIGWLFK